MAEVRARGSQARLGPGSVVERHPDVAWTVLGDEAVLHHLRTNGVYRLNHSATVVWRCLDGEATVGEIATDVAEGFGRRRREVLVECLSGVRELRGLGLLGGDVAQLSRDGGRHHRRRTPPRRALPVPAPGIHRAGPYAALEHRFVVEARDPGVVGLVAEVLAPLASPGPVDGAYRVGPGPAYEVTWRRRRVDAAGRPGDVAGLVMRSVNHAAVASVPAHAVLHAGAVQTSVGALLLVGSSGSGKSTLTAELVRRGSKYLTDEAVALDPATAEVLPYPKPVSLRPAVWTLFAGPATPPRTGDTWLVDPRRFGEHAVGSTCPVGAIVFPTYEPGRALTVEPVAPAETLVGLLRHSFPSAVGRRRAFEVLAGIAARVPALTVRYGDVTVTASALAGGCSA